MSDVVTTVRVKYEGLDLGLDAALETQFGALGFTLVSRGFNLVDEVRDFVFDRDERPVCPYCKEVMVKGHIEMEDGKWMDAWLCGCVGEDENTHEDTYGGPQCE